jgi:hypothetical protein
MDKSDFNTSRNTATSVKPSKFFSIIWMLFIFNGNINAQCPSTGVYTITSDINWTGISGIGTCSSSLTNTGSTFNGNVNISYSGANNDLTFNVNNLTINGNLNIQSTSNGNKFIIAPGTKLTIIGDLGDPSNNNISYELGSGSVLIVTGTLYGRNTNTIGGSGGTVSAGSINFTGNLNCSTGGCPVLYITNCEVPGSVCTTNNNTNICNTNYGGSISGNQFGCSSFDPTVLILSGHNGTILRWEKSIDNGSTWTGLNSVSEEYDPPSITQTTIYRTVILNTTPDSCISYSNTAKVTVSPATPATPGTITGTATQCPALTAQTYSITAVTNASTYNWTVPTGWSITAGAGTTSITVTTGSASQNEIIAVTAQNSCGTSAKSNLSVTVNPSPSAPTITITQPNCASSTGTITITAVSGQTYSFDNNSSYSAIIEYKGLNQGSSHTVYAKHEASGCISSVSSIINSLVTKTWDEISSSWLSNGVLTTAPTSNDLVIINGNYTTSIDNQVLNACSLTINAGKLEVQAGTSLIIQNDLTVNAGATLDVLDKGSLVMVKDSGIVTNTGTTKIRRFTTPFKRYDYVYWSTPVENTSISSTFQSIGWNTTRAYEYIPGSDWSFASIMLPGNGYIIMVPTPTTTIGGNQSEVIFSGKVNNGEKKITGVIPNSTYLLGNPYPSAINADVFLDANAGVLDGTLYFWTHNTAIQLASNIAVGNAGSGAYAYTSDDYATYNTTGGVATSAAKSSGNNKGIPTGKIASGQGFFASTKPSIAANSKIVYNNSMRLAGTITADSTGVNEQFFRTSSIAKAKTANLLEKHRIWLDLKNSQGAFKQTLVGYITGATNDYESRFDGESYDGNQFVDFYSVKQNKNLTIQGRAVPFDENDTVPLGFKTTIEGSFTINIGQVDGLLINQAVYLEDKLTNTVSNLKNGDYTFTTAKGTFNDRFVLRYTYKTLGINDTDKADGILVFYSNNYKTLIIKNSVMDATVNSVALFNTMGQRIANFDIKDSGQTNLQIPIKNIASGIYIVKVKTTKGESSKKVIVN